MISMPNTMIKSGVMSETFACLTKEINFQPKVRGVIGDAFHIRLKQSISHLKSKVLLETFYTSDHKNDFPT